MIRLAALGGIVLAVVAFFRAAPKMDIPTLFAVVLLGGVVIAILLAKLILPWIGDAVGSFFYSSGETVDNSQSLRAAAKVAQGDFAGAVSEYEKMLAANPADVFAISEIAKIQADRLEDPDKALQFLRDKLKGRQWSDEDAAFLRFREVDLLVGQADHAGAETALNEIMVRHANTRHAANAHHRLHEVRAAVHQAKAERHV